MCLVLAVFGCGGCGGGNGENEVRPAEESFQKYKAVRIVTCAFYSPFSFGLDTSVQGIDVDLGNEIAKAFGYEAKWIKAQENERISPDVARIYGTLREGGAEIGISALAIDPDKTQEFAYSKPYYETGDVIAILRTEVENIKGLADLSGKKVGVAKDRPGDRFMATQKTATGVTITKYPTLDDALSALNVREIDAVVGDEPTVVISSFKNFTDTCIVDSLINKYQYAVAVRKNETKVLAKINETIDRMKSSGDIDKSVQTHYGDVKQKLIERTKGDSNKIKTKQAPKNINVILTKLSGAWNMDRLDGFVLVLYGPKGQFQSTPILTEGNKGNCRFTTAVPPGDYQLKMSVLRNPISVPVPELEKTSLTLYINMGGSTTVQFK